MMAVATRACVETELLGFGVGFGQSDEALAVVQLKSSRSDSVVRTKPIPDSEVAILFYFKNVPASGAVPVLPIQEVAITFLFD